MKSRRVRLAVIAITLAVVGLGVVQTAEAVGGRGTLNPGHCKPCFPEPSGCSFFECDNHFCNYTCVAPDGSTYPLTTPRH